MSTQKSNSSQFVQLIRFCAIFICLGVVPAHAQTDAQIPAPALTPGMTLNNPEIDPSTITPHPPELNDRPGIPIPPAVTLPPIQTDPPKPSLAWRARAYVLSNEPPSTITGSKLAWCLPVSLDKSQALLTSALNQTGFQLISAYPAAGHYLVGTSSTTNTTQIIIVVQPLSNGLSSFQLRIYPENRWRQLKQIETLPEIMNTLLENRGLL